MGVSIANQAAPAPSVTLAYLKYLQGVAARTNPGGYYMWYQQQDRNLHNVIPGFASGQDGGPDAIPDLQKLSDIVTNFGP